MQSGSYEARSVAVAFNMGVASISVAYVVWFVGAIVGAPHWVMDVLEYTLFLNIVWSLAGQTAYWAVMRGGRLRNRWTSYLFLFSSPGLVGCTMVALWQCWMARRGRVRDA